VARASGDDVESVSVCACAFCAFLARRQTRMVRLAANGAICDEDVWNRCGDASGGSANSCHGVDFSTSTSTLTWTSYDPFSSSLNLHDRAFVLELGSAHDLPRFHDGMRARRLPPPQGACGWVLRYSTCLSGARGL